MPVIKKWRNLLADMVKHMMALQKDGLKATGYLSIEGIIDYDRDAGAEVDLDSPYLDKIGIDGPSVDVGISKEHVTTVKMAIRIET